MYNLPSIISSLESQLTEPGERQLFLSSLKDRLARLQQEAAQLDSAEMQNNSRNPESTGTHIPPQEFPTETEPGRTGTEPGRGGTQPAIPPFNTGTQPGQDGFNWDAVDAAIASLPEDLHDVATHLQEKVYHRSPFARLTSDQRKGLLDLIAENTLPEVVRIVAQPPPLGMNLKTSKQALSRFSRDHMRYELNSSREAQRAEAEKSRQADEEAFQKCNASDRAFAQAIESQIRRRLFETTRNRSANHQEIRWLVSSLAMLRKEYSATEAPPPRESPTPS